MTHHCIGTTAKWRLSSTYQAYIVKISQNIVTWNVVWSDRTKLSIVLVHKELYRNDKLLHWWCNIVLVKQFSCGLALKTLEVDVCLRLSSKFFIPLADLNSELFSETSIFKDNKTIQKEYKCLGENSMYILHLLIRCLVFVDFSEHNSYLFTENVTMCRFSL